MWCCFCHTFNTLSRHFKTMAINSLRILQLTLFSSLFDANKNHSHPSLHHQYTLAHIHTQHSTRSAHPMPILRSSFATMSTSDQNPVFDPATVRSPLSKLWIIAPSVFSDDDGLYDPLPMQGQHINRRTPCCIQSVHGPLPGKYEKG